MKIQLKIVSLLLVSNLLIEQKSTCAMSLGDKIKSFFKPSKAKIQLSKADKSDIIDFFKQALNELDLKGMKETEIEKLGKEELGEIFQKGFNSMIRKMSLANFDYVNSWRPEYFTNLTKKEYFDRAKEIMFYLISKGAVFSPTNAILLNAWLDLEKDQSAEAVKVKEAAAREATRRGESPEEAAARTVTWREMLERAKTKAAGELWTDVEKLNEEQLQGVIAATAKEFEAIEKQAREAAAKKAAKNAPQQPSNTAGKTELELSYEVLGISKTATNSEVKDAYKKLALVMHPDKPTGSKEKFQKLQTAFDKIKDTRNM